MKYKLSPFSYAIIVCIQIVLCNCNKENPIEPINKYRSIYGSWTSIDSSEIDDFLQIMKFSLKIKPDSIEVQYSREFQCQKYDSTNNKLQYLCNWSPVPSFEKGIITPTYAISDSLITLSPSMFTIVYKQLNDTIAEFEIDSLHFNARKN